MALELAERIGPVDQATAAARTLTWRKLVVTAALFSFGLSLQAGIFVNFAVNELNIAPARFGVMEAIRETGGFLTAFSGAATMALAEPLAAAGCLGLLGLGVGAYFFVASFAQLVAASFVWSVGFHLFHPLQQSMNLALARAGKEGRQLGRLQSYSAGATMLAYAFVFTFARWWNLSFRTLFLLAGASLLAGACVVATISRDLGTPERPRLVFKPNQYGLYYRLAFLEGCRKQFFITFAPLVLIRAFHFDRADISQLMFINALLSMLLARRFGAWIDRYGERRVLTINYVCLVLAFVGQGDGLNATIAWIYVGLRVAHSIWQATVNRVMVRFALLALSSLALIALIVHAAIAVFGWH
jgi:hypothetical protein